MYTIGIVSTKGGVGKTTLAANLGAILADFGLRVLLIDTDPQASLSKYFALRHQAELGLVDMINDAELSALKVSDTVLPNLHIVLSNDSSGEIQQTLPQRIDRGARIKHALFNPYVCDNYDVAIIDTQGAVGALQDAAVYACNDLLSPISPDILSAREFQAGTLEMLERLDAGRAIGLIPGNMKALIYKMDQTKNAKAIAAEINQSFMAFNGKVRMLETMVRSAKAYTEAATQRIPAHCHEVFSAAKSDSAYLTMHHLVWELFPNFTGAYTRCFRNLSQTEVDAIAAKDSMNPNNQCDIVANACAEAEHAV